MLRFDKWLHSTEKAHLIRIHNSEHWLPKKLCRNFVLNQKLGGNVSVPAFLYERITGGSAESVPEYDVDIKIETHVPQRIDPVEIEANKNLLR